MRKIASVLIMISAFYLQAEESLHNPKLEAVMSGIGGLVGSVSEHMKNVPATKTSSEEFTEMGYKNKVAALLVNYVIANVGTNDKGTITLGELAPKKLTTLSGKELEEKFDDVVRLLKATVPLLAKVEPAFYAQAATTDATKRTYTQINTIMRELGKVIKEAHDAFKPPKPEKS